MAPTSVVDLTSDARNEQPYTLIDDNVQRSRNDREWSIASSCTLDMEMEETIRDSGQSTPESDFLDLTDDMSSTGSPPPRASLTQVVCAAGQLDIDDLVKIRRTTLGPFEVDFLLITALVVDRAREQVIYGLPLIRCPKAAGKLVEDFYELCLVHCFERSAGSWGSPVQIIVRPEDVTQKRSITFTNKAYATSNHLSERRLICRWKLECYYAYCLTKDSQKPTEESFQKLSSKDNLPHSDWIDPEALQFNWRRRAAKTQPTRFTPPPTMGRPSPPKYTLFDAFSGAGGVSRGAQSAGFKVKYAVDKAPEV